MIGTDRQLQTVLGERLRATRRARRLSLTEVAHATSLSASFLSMIERGKCDITMARLLRIVAFYDLRIDDLLPKRPTVDQLVVRRDQRPIITSAKEGIEIYLLAPDTLRTMMPMTVLFDVGASTAEWESHPGEEFIHVVTGALELKREGEEPMVLREGDSVYFDATNSHSYSNSDLGITRIFEVVTPPTL